MVSRVNDNNYKKTVSLSLSISSKRRLDVLRKYNKRPMGHISHLKKIAIISLWMRAWSFRWFHSLFCNLTLLAQVKFAAIHRQWWRVHMSEKLSGGTQNKQTPWKRARSSIWTNLNSLQPRLLYAKFGWN